MKFKKIALITVTAFFISTFSSTLSLAADPVEIFANEVFDNYVTNKKPDATSFSSGALAVRTVKKNGTDKALFMQSSGDNAAVTYNISSNTQKLVIEADIMYRNAKPDGLITLKDKAGKVFNPVTMAADGGIFTCDGKNIGGIALNDWTHIAIELNTKTRKYSLYIDGVLKAGDWYIDNTQFQSPSAVAFSFTAVDKPADICLDNIRIYSGGKIMSNSYFPYKAPNLDEIEYKEEVIKDEPLGNKVFLNKTFEIEGEELAGLAIADKGNIVKLDYDKKRDSKYLYMYRTQQDCYFDISITEAKRYMIFETDLRTDQPGVATSVFTFKDAPNTFNYTATINRDGYLVLHNGTVISKMAKGKWYKVVAAYDFRKKIFDFYLDGKKVAEGIPMQNKEQGEITVCRIQMNADGMAEMDLRVDNLKIYEGKEPKELNDNDKATVESIFPPEDDVVNALDKTVALNINSGLMFANGKKYAPETLSIIKDGKTMMPIREVSKAFGFDVDWNDINKTITIDKKIQMAIGSKLVINGDKKIEIDTAPEIIDGRAYLPLRALAEKVLGKNVFWDNNELVVLSDSGFAQANNSDLVKQINLFMFNTRPKAAEIKELFLKHNQGNVHPRIMATTQDFDRIKEYVNSNALMKQWYDELLFRCESTIKAQPSRYEIPDGLRLLVTSRRVLDRTMELALAFRISGDKKYLNRVWSELEAAGKFPDWNPKHFLDVGEMTAAFATGYDWLYDEWTQEQRDFLKNAIVKFGLKNAQKAYYGQLGALGWWAKGDNNWNIVCNGGIMMGALAIADQEPDLCFEVLENAIRSTEYVMPAFAPDGAWYEGPGYWGYTVMYLAKMIGSLDTALGTDFGLSKYQGVSKTAEFILQMEGPASSNNFHDVGAGHQNPAELFWLAKKFDNSNVASARLTYMNMYKLRANALDMLWYNKDYESKDIYLPLDDMFRDTEGGSMRSTWTDTTGLFLSFHAGKSVLNHSHIDNGTFVLDNMGVRWAEDLGSEDYNLPGYFGSERWNYYRLRAESHNTIVINPGLDPGHDLNAFTKIEKQETKPRGSFSILDLTEALTKDAKSARRGFKLDDDRRSVVIRDEIELKKQSEVYWFMNTRADVKTEGDTAILTLGGKKMVLKFSSDAEKSEMYVSDSLPLPTSPNPEKQNPNKGYKKIVIKQSGSGKVNLTVKMYPETEELSVKPIDNSSVDEWTLPDGNIKAQPLLSNIYIDDKAITGFNKLLSSQMTQLPFGTENIPVVTADGSNVKIDIKQAEDLSKSAVIKVTDIDDSENFKVYVIGFQILPQTGIINGMKQLSVSGVKASDVPQPENPETSAIDGNLETRWSADGDGQWIELDLGSVNLIDAVAIAFFSGDIRSTKFDIMLSENGTDYIKAYTGESSGTTKDYETVSVGSHKARYVRVVGHGNSSNTWNSISDIAVLSK